MQRIKSYKMFESRDGLNGNQIRFLDNFVTGTWRFDEVSGLVNIKGSIDFPDRGFLDFNGINFGRVSGDFDCSSNELETLEGSPVSVGGSFLCGRNRLGDLLGSPNYVEGGFDASNNGLVTLEGAPEEIGGYFEVSRNRLTDLDGAPVIVGGDFICSRNPLTSLKGAPEKIGGEFESSYFSIPGDEWNVEGWLDRLDKSDGSSEGLLLSIITARDINRRIQESPTSMIKLLSPFWNWSKFASIQRDLVFPKELGDIPSLMARVERVKDIGDFI